jgi:coenzyme PQQ biosynthesis protein PqqD
MIASPDMNSITKLVDRYTETTVADEVVVMHLASGDFFSLTDSAKAIWEHIDGQRSREAIIEDLATEYGTAAADIAADVDEFLARLRNAGLLARG